MPVTKGVKRLVGSNVDDGTCGGDIDFSAFKFETVDPRVKEEGEQLFDYFLQDQFNSHNDQVCLQVALPPSTPIPMTKPELSNVAARLCMLTASFAQTDERKMVRETAIAVSTDVSCEDLATILITMIANTHHLEEGIVVLFYFCFDLAMRVLENGFGEFWDFIRICKAAIIKAVGPKVQANGGWGNVIRMAASGSAFLGMVATGFFVAARLGLALL